MSAGDELDDEVLSAVWSRAGQELGIDITAPWEYPPASGHQCLAFLGEFGSANGMIVLRLGDVTEKDIRGRASAEGYYVSAVNPLVYANFDRAHFIDTINDWGWHGEGLAPAWYEGTGS